VNIPRWLTPWRKHTDLNTVTPIRSPLRQSSAFGWIVESFGGSWQSNRALESTQNMLAFSAVYACQALIAGDVAKLGINLLRHRDDSTWQPEENPAYSRLLRTPNRFQTRIQFLNYWMTSKLTHGNAYVLLERDQRRVVSAMYPLDPRAVMPMVAGDGSVYYRIQSDDLAGVKEGGNLIPASEIIHDRGPCLFHPLVGVSPLYACASSTTQGIRIQDNSARFFENMSRPSGQLTAPGKIDDITAERIKKQFEEGFAANNLGRILVTGSDLKFEPFTMPAEQSQLIEQLKFTVEDVARAFGVPLYKIAAGQTPAHTNVAALNLEYYQQALQIHIESIETLLDQGLGLGSDLCVELDLDGLYRMDPKTLAEADEIGVRSGIVAPNEARAKRNLKPVTGGASPYLQQQNYSLSALAKRDASEDPFQTAAPAARKEPAAADDEDISDEDKVFASLAFKNSNAWAQHRCATLQH